MLSLNTTNGSEDALAEYMEQLNDMIVPLLTILIILGLFFMIIFLLSLGLIPSFLRRHRGNRENWMKFAEFPIINHSYHVIRTYYVGYVGSMFIIGPILGFAFVNFNIKMWPLLLVAFVLAIICFVCCYIVQLFTQVYLVTIAYELVGLCKNKDDLKEKHIEHEQRVKRSWIKKLYLIFIARDFLLMPALIIYDVVHIYQEMATPGLTMENVFVSQIVGMIISAIIYLMVPMATLYSIIMKISSNEKPISENPLRRLMFVQGVVISSLIMMIIVAFGILFIIDHRRSFNILIYGFQATGLMLPLQIQMTTLIVCKKADSEASANQIAPIAPPAYSEKSNNDLI
ncbi:hypothetical protein GCK72_020721 [Caenorhabditis remanei]|uniref:Uncharacterized protein n=1 Tax=Caenorhabditis remanei TaxID=31234 RepID=A0A6A5GHT8_CAERE|nr:hypothetical protein GCK72_020721 [Caenorhabditis remanei]KAF1754161.1 hypothetical protein GCK72_020721 [Caenorhabditis remanei]